VTPTGYAKMASNWVYRVTDRVTESGDDGDDRGPESL
jgi:hypothetical protein